MRIFSSARSGRASKVYFAPPFLILMLFSASLLLQIPAGYIIHNISFTAGMFINQLGTLLIPALVVVWFFGLTAKEIFPFRRITFLQVVLSVLIILSLAVITDYLVYVTELVLPINKKLDVSYREMMQVDGLLSYIHKLTILCLLPSFCEEIFFRGFCQTGLENYYGKKWGIIIVAAIFSVAHLSLWYIHLYFLLGLFLSWLFSTSKTLWVPIICHVVNNFWTFSAHSFGLTVPFKGSNSLLNVPILFVSAVGLFIGVFFWVRMTNEKESAVKKDGCKIPFRQSLLNQ